MALIVLVAAAAPFGFGRAAPVPQLPALSISDGTMVGDGAQIEFTVTLTGRTEPTTTSQPATTTQPAAALPATGSSVVPIVLVAATLIVAGLAAFALRRVVSPPLLVLMIGAAAGAAAVFGASVAYAQQTQPVVTVNYHTEDGTATAPQDYTATNGTIRFAAGQTTATIVVAISPTLDDSGKTFFVELTDPVGATIAKAVGMATIIVESPATTTTEPATTTTTVTTTTDASTTTTSSTSTTSTTTGVNNGPSAADDSYLTAENSPLIVTAPGVLSNDNDPDGDTMSAVLVSGPSNGTLTLNPDGSFTYAPAPNFNGTDSFTYQADDGASSSNTATVTITVTAVNNAPTAADDSYTSDAVVPSVALPAPGVLSNDTDPDGDTLSAILVSGPSHARSFVLSPLGALYYDPEDGFSGTDSFTYQASDGTLISNVATVTITVAR